MNPLSPRICFIITIAAALTAGPIEAGPPPEPGPAVSSREIPAGLDQAVEGALDLEACVRIALNENPALQAAMESVASAGEGVGIARSPYYPAVNLDAGYRRWETHAFLPSSLTGMGINPVIGPIDDWSAGLKAGYVLFDSGERAARLRASLSQQGLAEEEETRIRQDIALAVHLGFYGLLSAEEAQQVAEQNLERSEDHLRMAQEFYDAGAVPQADVIRARVEVANGKLQLVRATGATGIARGQLNLAMGLAPELKTEIKAGPEKIESPEGLDLAGAIEQAVSLRPEIKAAIRRSETAQSSIDVAKSSFGPDVSANAAYGYRDSEFLPGDKDWAVGVSINVPVFQGFRRTHDLAKARHDLARQEAEIRSLSLRVREEVWASHLRFKEFYEAVQASEAVVVDARESMRMTRERYEAGVATATDLLDAQTTLARAEYVRLEARWSCFSARSALSRAMGTILDNIIQ